MCVCLFYLSLGEVDVREPTSTLAQGETVLSVFLAGLLVRERS